MPTLSCEAFGPAKRVQRQTLELVVPANLGPGGAAGGVNSDVPCSGGAVSGDPLYRLAHHGPAWRTGIGQALRRRTAAASGEQPLGARALRQADRGPSADLADNFGRR